MKLGKVLEMVASEEDVPKFSRELQLAIRRYGWVVSFPSFKNLLFLLFGTSICSWIILVPQGSSLEAAFAWIMGLAIIPLLLDSAFLRYKWYRSSILDRRRLVAVSVVCNGIFTICILAASILSIILPARILILSATFFGMSISFLIRFAALSALGAPRIRIGSTSLYFLTSFALALQGLPTYVDRIGLGISLIACWFISTIFYSWILASINKIGLRKIGVPGLAVFNAYFQSRLIGFNQDFEDILDKLGEEGKVDCWLMLFKDEEGKNILGIACTSAHFGPFDNVGSGGLSHELRLALEEKLRCPVMVMRALSDHSKDLTSRKECEKLISEFPTKASLEELYACSPLVTETAMNHTATSLVTDSFCLIILSRSPMPTEDMPGRVRDLVFSNIASYGIKEALIVDAHNCIGNLMSDIQDIEAEFFAEAASRSIAEASVKVGNFQVGFCRVHPPNIGIEDGLGPDGISAVVFRHQETLSSLVALDGNNMVVGLNDRIKGELRKSLTVSGSEVVTTDTHLMTGLSRVQGGYNPIGEKIGHDILARFCLEAVSRAIETAKSARISVASGVVGGLRVVGQGLARLAELLDVSISAIKRSLILSLSLIGFLSYLVAILI